MASQMNEAVYTDEYLAAIIYLYTGILPDVINHEGFCFFTFPVSLEVLKAMRVYESGLEVDSKNFVRVIQYFKSKMIQLQNDKKSTKGNKYLCQL